MVLLQRKLYFSKNPERVQDFPGGQTFPRGPNANCYRKAYNLCFSRWCGPPIPPLGPHMAMLSVIDICAYTMGTD